MYSRLPLADLGVYSHQYWGERFVSGEVRSHLLKKKVMAMTCVSYIGGVFFSVVHVLYMLCAKSAGCTLSVAMFHDDQRRCLYRVSTFFFTN